jgi:hypothetical protein
MLKLIPKNVGFRGDIDAAMREAKATEFGDVTRLVRDTLRGLIHQDKDRWIDVVAIYANEVVIELNGKFWMYGYSIDEGNRVVLLPAREVVREYSPVGLENVTECVPKVVLIGGPSNALLLESLDNKLGLKWRVKVVESGLSKNNNFYPDAVLLEAVALFEGQRVFNKSDEEHLKGKGKSFNNIIGKLSNVAFVEGKGKDNGYLEADLNLLATAGVHEKMLEAFQADMHDLFGFSIDADAQAKRVMKGKQRITEARRITKVNSLDLIVEPGAGGSLINLLEATGANIMLLKKMVEAIQKHRPQLLEGVDHEDENAVNTAHEKMLEALAKPNEEPAPEKVLEQGDGLGVTQTQLKEALDVERARTFAVTTLNACNLPANAVTQLQKQFDADEGLTNACVIEAVKDMQDLASSFSKSGHIQMGDFMHSNVDDGKQLLEALLDPKDTDVTSLREAYLSCTGDKHFSGRVRDCSASRMTEALDTTSFPDALGEAMHKVMLDLYKSPTVYDSWQAVTDVVSVSDFRNQERVSIGGYGDLSVVAESGNYPAMTSPTDNVERYQVQKRGGTETVTLEMIANDDIGALLRIPPKLVAAAKRTLSKFIWNMFTSNPALADTNAWFHASRNNLGTSALSAAAFSAVRLAMMRQTEPGSDAELGLMAKYLMVPPELEEAAFDLFRRDTNLDETFAQSLKPTIIPVWAWSDANDWVVAADKSESPIIEVGFFQGRQEPELFIQDNPTVGSMFTNDTTTYKLRHIYGGAPMSGQAVFKNVVA